MKGELCLLIVPITKRLVSNISRCCHICLMSEREVLRLLVECYELTIVQKDNLRNVLYYWIYSGMDDYTVTWRSALTTNQANLLHMLLEDSLDKLQSDPIFHSHVWPCIDVPRIHDIYIDRNTVRILVSQ